MNESGLRFYVRTENNYGPERIKGFAQSHECVDCWLNKWKPEFLIPSTKFILGHYARCSKKLTITEQWLCILIGKTYEEGTIISLTLLMKKLRFSEG